MVSQFFVRHLLKLLKDIECDPFKFKLGCPVCETMELSELAQTTVCQHNVWYIQAKLWRKDTITGKESWGYGGKYLVVPSMKDREIVLKCFSAARDYAEHEVREAFKYKGLRIAGPHIPLEVMCEAAEREQE